MAKRDPQVFMKPQDVYEGKSPSYTLRARDKNGRFVSPFTKKGTPRKIAVKFELYDRRARKVERVYTASDFRKIDRSVKPATRVAPEARAVLSFLPDRYLYQAEHVNIISTLPLPILQQQMKTPPYWVYFHYWLDGVPKRISVRGKWQSQEGQYRIRTNFGKQWQSNLRRWLIGWLKRFSRYGASSESKLVPVGFEPLWSKHTSSDL